MKELPLYDYIGSYGYFFEEEEELRQYLTCNASLEQPKRKLFLICDHTGSYNENLMNIEVHQISRSDYEDFLNPYLPNWILYDDVYQNYANNDYLSVMPKSAEIVPTLNCCFRCHQCSYRSVKDNFGIWDKRDICYDHELHMTIKSLHTIINRLVDVGIKNVVFTGGGEPLLNQDVTLYGMKTLSACGVNTGLYTNGVFLDEAVISELAHINPLFIRISIYGMDPRSFARYTNSNEGTFYRVLDNVKSLVKAKLEGRLESAISLSFLLHPLLFPDKGIINNFFSECFSIEELQSIAMIRFTPAVDYISGKQHEMSFFNDILSCVNELSNKYDGVTVFTTYKHRIEDLYKRKEYEVCKASGYIAEVSPNGDLYLCCEKLMDDGFVIGNILKNEIPEIYKSAKRLELINRINKEHCFSCPSLCKPHEMNKQLNRISCMQRQELDQWRNDVMSISRNTPYFPGRYNAFES